ncbi:MAG: hypothetical protein ABIA04_08370, partial [Pseudomonadota bacterium]
MTINIKKYLFFITAISIFSVNFVFSLPIPGMQDTTYRLIYTDRVDFEGAIQRSNILGQEISEVSLPEAAGILEVSLRRELARYLDGVGRGHLKIVKVYID